MILQVGSKLFKFKFNVLKQYLINVSLSFSVNCCLLFNDGTLSKMQNANWALYLCHDDDYENMTDDKSSSISLRVAFESHQYNCNGDDHNVYIQLDTCNYYTNTKIANYEKFTIVTWEKRWKMKICTLAIRATFVPLAPLAALAALAPLAPFQPLKLWQSVFCLFFTIYWFNSFSLLISKFVLIFIVEDR